MHISDAGPLFGPDIWVARSSGTAPNSVVVGSPLRRFPLRLRLYFDIWTGGGWQSSVPIRVLRGGPIFDPLETAGPLRAALGLAVQPQGTGSWLPLLRLGRTRRRGRSRSNSDSANDIQEE